MNNPMKILAIVLLVGGTLALVYGGFTYTKSSSEAELGPISLVVNERERVNLPVWVGVLGIVVGGGLLVASGRKG